MASHAVRRAWQRYGVELEETDLVRIAALGTPENRLKSHQGGDTHAVAWRQALLLAVIRETESGRVVVTFLPPDAFARQPRVAFRRSTKGKPATTISGSRRSLAPVSRSRRRGLALEALEED